MNSLLSNRIILLRIYYIYLKFIFRLTFDFTIIEEFDRGYG